MPFLMRTAVHGIKDRAITLKLQEAMTGNFEFMQFAYQLLLDELENSLWLVDWDLYRDGKINPGGNHGCRISNIRVVGFF